MRQIYSNLDRTSLVRKRIFSSGTNVGNTQRAGWAHQGSQSEHKICFILPTREFSHTIRWYIDLIYNHNLVSRQWRGNLVDLALTELTKMAKSSWLSIDETAELY